MVGIEQFKPEKRKYAFHGEGASINKVSVEKIRIGFRWQPINAENIEQIVELTVNIATHGKLALVWYIDIHQGWLFLEKGLNITQDLQEEYKI